jgi:hypothetical protein
MTFLYDGSPSFIAVRSKNTTVKLAQSKRGRRPAVAESPESCCKEKKSKQCHSIALGSDPVDDDKDVTQAGAPAGPVKVNDPTIGLSVAKSLTHDIWHFFLKGKDGQKTVFNTCQ